MQVKLVTQRMLDTEVKRSCPLCRRSVRVGQYVLHHKLDPAAFADSTLNIHVACVKTLVATTPEDAADPSCMEQEAQRIFRVLAG